MDRDGGSSAVYRWLAAAVVVNLVGLVYGNDLLFQAIDDRSLVVAVAACITILVNAVALILNVCSVVRARRARRDVRRYLDALDEWLR